MKRKHVIATFALSALLGVGVFAGLHAHEAREARAATEVTVYYAISASDVGTYTVAYNAKLQGDEVADNVAEWTNGNMTDTGDTYNSKKVYSATFSETYGGVSKLQFQLYDGGDWKSQVEPYTSGWHNASTHNGKIWEKGGTEWADYNVPTPSVYKVSIAGGAEQTLVVNPGNEDEYQLANPVDFTAGQQLTFTKDDAAYAVTAGADGQYDSNNVDADLKIKKAATTNLYLNKSANTVWVGGLEKVDGNAYLQGSFNNWTGVETTSAVTENVATFQNIDLAANGVVKAFVYDKDGVDAEHQHIWKTPTSIAYAEDYGGEYTATIEGGNVKVAVAGNYDISVNTSTGVYTIKANDYVEHAYTIKIGDGAPAPMTRDGSEYKIEGVTVAAGDTFTFTKDSAAYAATAENASNNNYGSHGVRKGGTVNIYLKPASDQFWVSGIVAPEEDATYYMLINDKNPVKMTDNTAQTANEYYLTHVELAVDDEISFLYVSDDQADPTVYAYYNITTLKEGSVDFYKTDSNKVKTAGIYDLYADMTNENNKLYVAVNTEGWIRYLDVDGVKLRMDVNPENENEYVAQASLEAGDKLAYYYGPNQADATEQTTTAKAIYNNNLNANKEVLVDTTVSVSVYVDIQANTIWAGGIETAGFHIIKNGHTLITMTHGDEFDGYDQWYSASVAFAKDDELTFINTTADLGEHLPVVFGIGFVETSTEGANFEVIEGTPDVIKAKAAITTMVYLKLKNTGDHVYFGAEEEHVRLAKEFVEEFKTAMATSCAAEGKKAAVEAAWAAKATAFAALATEVQDDIKEGAGSSVAEIREFHERYVAIKQQHSDWTLDNFAQYAIAPANYNTIGFKVDDNTMLVVVISSVAIISAAGLFFLIRRKRHLVK